MTNERIIYLLDNLSGELVEATLTSRLTIREIELTEGKDWKPVIQNTLANFEKMGIPKSKWPQHTGWSWREKHRKLSNAIVYRFFGIRRDNKLQGLMLLSTLLKSAKFDEHKNKPILYIQYIETAPWNLADFVDKPLYSLVGTNFIHEAIAVSKEEECKGRLCLHSLPQSDEFYSKCGMINLGPDADFGNLNYFEMTSTKAETFINEEGQS